MSGQACKTLIALPAAPAVYRPRRPQQTDLYRIIQQHLQPFLAARQAAEPEHLLPAQVEKTFYAYLACGIMAHGFARAFCETCGRQYLVAFSCKTRGLCPSCGAKYMSGTAAHLVDNVLPRVPYRQWVLSLPKRIRYFVLHDARHAAALQKIFLKNIESALRQATLLREAPVAVKRARTAAVSFTQRAGSSLNQHLHFHSIVADGLFAIDQDKQEAEFCETPPLSTEQLEQLTEKLRRKILAYMVKHTLLDRIDAEEMLTWQHHGGFSVDASVRIEAWDRLALERLIRYCARPPFAESRLTYLEPDRVVYRLKPGNSTGQTQLIFSPMDFIKRLAQLIPPPRVHRNVYYGAIAPHAKLRPYVIKNAGPPATTELNPKQAKEKMGLNQPQQMTTDVTIQSQKQKQENKRKASRAWALLLARIYEVLPLICNNCKQPMKIIAFVTEPQTIRTILTAIREDPDPPQLAQPRAPPDEVDFISQETVFEHNQAPPGW